MDEQAVNNVQINDEGLNKQMDKELVREYVEGDNFAKNARQAKNLDGAVLQHNDRLSMEKTQEDTEIVSRLITKLERDELNVDKKELKQARLESLKERNIAHLMVNSQKLGGDSPEMTRVKKAVSRVEKAIARKSADSLTVEDMEKLQENYYEAIEACQKYLKKKTSFISAWKYRKDMVRKTMERLLYENKLITMGKTLFALDKPTEPINSGLDLMAVARMYQLTNDMRTIKHERKYHIEKKVVGGVNVFGFVMGGQEVEEKVYDEEEKKLKTVEKLSTQQLAMNFNTSMHEYTMFDHLQNSGNKNTDLLLPRKKFSTFSKEQKLYVFELRKIREILSRFNRDEVNTSIIKIGDTYANVIQRDDNSVYIEAKGHMMPLGNDAMRVLHDMENDIIANLDKYEDVDILSVVNNMYINFNHMNSGDLIRMRNAFCVILSHKTGIKRTDFDNLSVEQLKQYATAAASGINIIKGLQNAVKNSSPREKDHITNMLAYELSRLQKQEEDKVEYIPPNKIKLFNGTVLDKNEDTEKGWNIHEANSKKLLTELLYDPEATEADYSIEIDEKEREKFKKQMAKERAQKVKDELKEGYEASGEYVLEEDKEAQKAVDKAARMEIEELNEEDPIDDEMYLDYKKGLRMKELLKRNVDGIASLLSDIYRDKKENPEGFIVKMMDKLPLFVVDEEGVAEMKSKLTEALDEVAEMLNKQLDFNKLGVDKDAAISAIRMGLPQIKDMIAEKIEELDLDMIVALGRIQSNIDDVVDEASEKIQNMMETCADEVFKLKDDEKKKEEKENPEDENDEEQDEEEAVEEAVEDKKIEAKKEKKDKPTELDPVAEFFNLADLQSAKEEKERQLQEIENEKKRLREERRREQEAQKESKRAEREAKKNQSAEFDAVVDFMARIDEEERILREKEEAINADIASFENLILDEQLTEEEQEAAHLKDAPLRIERLKRATTERRAKLKSHDNAVQEARNELKLAKKDKDAEQITAWTEELKKRKEERQKYIESEKNALDKTIQDSVKGNRGPGLYIKNVMKSYFKSMPTMDKRSMLANAIKNASPVEKPDELTIANLTDDQRMDYFSDILGGLFKGAGPLFQKMLQGIPTSSLPRGLAKAIDQTKDSLLPIPEKVIKQQLNGIIQRSEGRIDSIKVEKSLGAASVGQAFLCTVKGPGFEEGKKVVVKLLRPDAKNRMMREYKVMHEAARKTDKGMVATFEGQFKRVEEELDLTIEARHVEEGKIYNNASDRFRENHVKSMKLLNVTTTTSDCMVIELAEGTTVKQYISDKWDMLDGTMDKYYEKVKDKKGKEVYKTDENGKYILKTAKGSLALNAIKDKLKLISEYKDLKKRQKYLLELSDKWVYEGIFGKGFYHGDLHSGNIMISENDATVIDFGNCTQLTKAQQDHIIRMVMAAATGETDIFLDGFKNLLEKTSEEEFEKKKPELRAIFRDVLSTGDKTCSGQRIAVALLKAQEMGLELPAAVANFSSSQVRLQNTIDETNKVMNEIKKNIEALDMLESGNSDELYATELMTVTYSSLKSVENAGLKLSKLKDVRAMSGGISREGLFKALKTKDKSERMEFMFRNIGTPSIMLDMMDFLCTNECSQSLRNFFMDKYNSEELDHEMQIFTDNGIEISKKAFDSMMSTLSLVYANGKLEGNAKNIREEVDLLEPAQEYVEVNGETVIKETDCKTLFVETEFDKALKAYLNAVDAAEPVPEEEMKKLEDKVWEEYQKKEAHADEVFQKNPKNKGKFRKLYQMDDEDLKKKLTYDFPEEKDSIEQKQGNVFNNATKIERGKLEAEALFEDEKYGKELKEQYEKLEALYNQMAKHTLGEKTDGKDTPAVPKEEFDKLIEKIVELTNSAKLSILDSLIDEHEKQGFPNELDKSDPKDFMDVMSDVLEAKKYTAVWKFNIFKALKHRKTFVEEDD